MIVAALILALFQGGSPTVRFDSREQGRTFYVDADKPEIRQALRDVSAPSPAGSIPDWLLPYPGAREIPHQGTNDPIDFGVAVYATTAAPDVVLAHYQAAIQAANATVTYINQRPGRGGAIHVEDATRTAVVSVSPGPGPTDISVNWRPKIVRPVPLAKSARLNVVWYDDTKQILRLKDPATAKEYELGMATMLRYAHSVALEPSARTDFPPWIAFYPNAKIITANAPPVGWQPTKVTDMRSYKLELESTASVADIAAFYKETLVRNGFIIVSETKSGTTRYALEARSTDRMHQLYLDVLQRAKDTGINLMDHYTLPRP
jgi:hypothetical protein